MNQHRPDGTEPSKDSPGSPDTCPEAADGGGTTTAYRTCPLCEAGCGLEVTLVDGRVKRIRGDRLDVASRGYICPKGSTLKDLHQDPDWLRRPLVREGGELVETDWETAFERVREGLGRIIAEHGKDAVGIYLGNPGAHSLAPMMYSRAVITSLGTGNRFSASTVDQRPKEISASLMFGSVAVPVPDLDRTDLLVMLGANPHASNGSLCTAPNFKGRIEAIRSRGGTVVVVDPRLSETAMRADLHLAIRPGTDAHLLAALARLLLKGDHVGDLAGHCAGLGDLPGLLAPFTPEAAATVTGLDPAQIVDLAGRLARTPRAAVYGRIGTCTQEFGTLASWLVDVVNILAGNLDVVGGAMFAKGAVGQPSTKGEPGRGRGFRMNRVRSRVSGVGETLGEFPVAVMAEEIETPGEGQIRAMVTIAGNPVSSAPNAARIDAALASLDFMVCVDPYVNETTRHADVILPPPSSLQKGHYDLALLNFAVHNVANYSPPVLPLEEGQMAEWEILCRLALAAAGQGPEVGPEAIDDMMISGLLASAVRDVSSPVHGRDPAELLEALGGRRGPERMLDAMLRSGPYGDGFGTRPDGLSLDVLLASPHGVDLGELEPGRIPELLRTPSGKIEMAPEPLVEDMSRLVDSLDRPWDEQMVLVGRRHVRSNNSWMHNVRVLTKGRNRCTMQIHPEDAARFGLTDGSPARVRSRTGEVIIDTEVTDGIRPGVVSIPHGFGQNLPGVRLRVATEYRGVNTNLLTDDAFLDPLSGNAALNGVPVEVAPAG